VQRCSSSIASLAAALAKAQAVLVNPEKSLVGTIPTDRVGGPQRRFRYASLASGLDIVRKTLGEHEIATVQTTAIDQIAGIVNLTTVLAHSSGEWIASDWPVCAIAETATPRRMGAALTYARRYALFTLVGIAGEDDLDAPDLDAAADYDREPARAAKTGSGAISGGSRYPGPQKHQKGRVLAQPASASAHLDALASAELRDRLLIQVAEIASADDAALWAYRNIAVKNNLAAADAVRVESAFQDQLATLAVEKASLKEPFEAGRIEDASTADLPAQRHAKRLRRPDRKAATDGTIDKSLLAFPEPRRVRDRAHVRFVSKQPCLACGRTPCDVHHLRFAQSRALGRKVSDEFTVPLCRGHHREVHRGGNEAAWWSKLGIDATVAARALWLETHPLPPRSKTTRTSGSIAGSSVDQNGRRRAAGRRRPDDETKPIAATGAQ
jgi:ERF superfamily